MTVLSRFHRWNSCVRFWTLSLTFTSVLACSAQTQQSSGPRERIAQDLKLIKMAQQQHLPNKHIGYEWAVLASEYRKAGDFTASEDAYFKALNLLEHSPSAARN